MKMTMMMIMAQGDEVEEKSTELELGACLIPFLSNVGSMAVVVMVSMSCRLTHYLEFGLCCCSLCISRSTGVLNKLTYSFHSGPLHPEFKSH